MDADETSAYLNPPVVERKVHDGNFIEACVLELRFPTILGLEKYDPKPIADSLKKRLPAFQRITNHSFSPHGVSLPQHGFEFSSRNPKDGAFKIFESTLNLRVERYKSYEEFSELVSLVLEAVNSVIDSEFFTRVGYRIINYVPVPGSEPLEGYVNEDLISPLDFSVLGKLKSSLTQIRGSIAERKGYLFQFGVADSGSRNENYLAYDNDGNLRFVLDYDYYADDVDSASVTDLLNEFHSKHYSFFWWALGDKAKKMLEKKGV